MEVYNSNLLGSSAVLTVLGVAAVSAYISGPLIVDRMSIKMNWVSDCIKIIEREIKFSAPQQPVMPQISCDSMLNMAGRDWGNLARTFGLDQASLERCVWRSYGAYYANDVSGSVVTSPFINGRHHADVSR